MVNLSMAETLKCNTDEDTEFTTELGYKDSKIDWRSHKAGSAYDNGVANE